MENKTDMTPPAITNMEDTRRRVEAALDRVRPALQADGGDAEIVDISERGVVTLQLVGACGGCAMSTMTLKNGIERVIKMEVPEILSVESMNME
ncbi:MAG: NifU family protein [Elusimicrobiota bacterium]